MNIYDLVHIIETNDLETLQTVLATDIDPNSMCQYTGMTALLSACSHNNIHAAQILLMAGANPNCMHRDGYNCYDTTSSLVIKQLLIEYGFSLVLPTTSTSAFSVGYRLLSPSIPTKDIIHLAMWNEAKKYKLEYQIFAYPPSKGHVTIRIEPIHKMIHCLANEPIHNIETLDLQESIKLILIIEFHSFQGEVRVRLYDERVLDSDLSSLVTYPWIE